MYYPIISHSSKKGYRMVDVKKLIEENDRDEINKEIGEIQHTLRELNSRIKMLKKKQKPLIAALKVLEKGNK
jgi:sugar-specific transcriptional regulator TrmB